MEEEGPIDDPIAEFVKQQGVLVLDGGLATALEAHGCDLDDELWSAKVLLEAPDEIRRVHREYLAAGADCIKTSTYQASLPGFAKRGLSETEGVDLLLRSVEIALEARDEFWAGRDHPGRLRPIVAASIGPYGAFLADGSEYTGRYDVDDDALYEFHRRRWHVLARSAVDLLACETIPSGREAHVLLRLARETPDRCACMTFSCRDGAHLHDGSRIADVVSTCDAEPCVVGVGVNCTSPELIPSLITEVRKSTSKPVIVYPNSGERYDPTKRAWIAPRSPVDLTRACLDWARLGATCIGGCCRVGAPEIAGMRRRLVTD